MPQAIEWIQAALMLGLHEWGMCRGSKAWLTIGSAIRAAQAMGLQYELELDDEPMSRSLALISEAERLGVESSQGGSVASVRVEEDVFVQQEVRRRTFWSCFIMDRYLSSGKYRPQMLHARELRIQLPASERSFLFAEKVRTLMLGEEEHQVARAEVQSHRQASVALANGDTPEPHPASSLNGTLGNEEDKGRLESGADEGLVSHYIKILEIYGRVVQWSCAGGRRSVQLFSVPKVTLLNSVQNRRTPTMGPSLRMEQTASSVFGIQSELTAPTYPHPAEYPGSHQPEDVNAVYPRPHCLSSLPDHAASRICTIYPAAVRETRGSARPSKVSS